MGFAEQASWRPDRTMVRRGATRRGDMNLRLSAGEPTAGRTPIGVCKDGSARGCIQIAAERGVRAKLSRIGPAPKQGAILLSSLKRLPARRLIGFFEHARERD